MTAKTVKTFNGHTLNSTSYRSVVLNSNALPAAAGVWISESEADSVDSGTYTVEVRNVIVSIRIIDYPNRYSLLDTLKAWIKRGTRGNLVATLEDGADYQLDCRAKNLVQDPDDPWLFTALLESGNTAWRAVTADTDSWSVTSTGGTHALTVGGSDETKLSLTLTATASPAAGYLYQRLIQLVNVPGVNFGNRAMCITLDTQALVAASKCQADCDDVRVFVDGSEVNRWIADPNTNHTHIWFNTSLGAGYALTLATAISSGGAIGTIDFIKNPTNKALLKNLPASGFLYHGTEWIAYSGKNLAKYQVYVTKRGSQGTTLQAHAVSDYLYYIQHAVTLYYGNTSATAPALSDANYDLTKPNFNLSSSDNTKRVVTATETTFQRDWALVLGRVGPNSTLFSYKDLATSGDPVLGITAAAYLKGIAWKGDTVKIGYKFYDPGGIKTVTATGRKYRTNTKWPALVGLQKSTDGVTWTTVWNDATPSVAATWEAWAAHSSVAITDTTKYLFFSMTGVSDSAANSYGATEMQTYTIEFTTAKIPGLTLFAERSNYTLVLRILNDSVDGDPFVELVFPMELNHPFAMDGENYTASYDYANAHGAMTLDDQSRVVWIPLVVGSNSIILSSSDLGTLGVVATWYKRRL